jgi:hypothetical protein
MFERDHARGPRVEVTDARFGLAGGGSAQGALVAGRPLRGAVARGRCDLAQSTRASSPRGLRHALAATTAGAQRFEVALADPRFAVEGAATLQAGASTSKPCA